MIINADDFGLSSSVNKAIVECFQKNIINQTTIMVNMPAFDEAVLLAKEHDLMNKVGIHLNIDYGIPLTDKIKTNPNFCNAKGEFNGKFKTKPLHILFMPKFDRECLKEEIEAQFEKYINAGFSLMHFDSHHHNHVRYSVLKLIIPLARKHKFQSCRIARNIFVSKPNIFSIFYKKRINKLIQKNFKATSYFGGYAVWSAMKHKLKSNSIEVMVHPDYHNDKLVDIVRKGVYRDILSYF